MVDDRGEVSGGEEGCRSDRVPAEVPDTSKREDVDCDVSSQIDSRRER